MIRVMNIISDTNIGGAGRVILNYLRYTDRSRFETWVAVPRGSLLVPPLEEAGAKVFQVDGIADRSYSRADVRVLEELIRREKRTWSTPMGPSPGASRPGGAMFRWCTAATLRSQCPPSCAIPQAGG